jgi:hypothetical protein
MKGQRRPRTLAAYKRRQRLAGVGIASAALVGFAGVSIAMANNECVGQVECDSEAGMAAGETLPIVTDPPASIDPTTTAANVVTPSGVVPVETVAPTTLAPTTTVLQNIPYFAVGESVMLGAKPVLEARGIKTAAEVSKGPTWELEQLRAAKSHYNIKNGVVIQLGTNGSVTRDQYEAVLDELPPDQFPLVVMLTVKAPKPWIDPNNEIIRSLPDSHPNVKVLDWQARAEEISDHLSHGDGGVHLADDTAKHFYRDIILEALGVPT